VSKKKIFPAVVLTCNCRTNRGVVPISLSEALLLCMKCSVMAGTHMGRGSQVVNSMDTHRIQDGSIVVPGCKVSHIKCIHILHDHTGGEVYV